MGSLIPTNIYKLNCFDYLFIVLESLHIFHHSYISMEWMKYFAIKRVNMQCLGWGNAKSGKKYVSLNMFLSTEGLQKVCIYMILQFWYNRAMIYVIMIQSWLQTIFKIKNR